MLKRSQNLIKVSMEPSLVFIDAKALEETFLPDSLIGREKHLHDVLTPLRSFVLRGSPIHLLLHGRPGTGKTAIARQALRQLADEPRARTAYVNCWESPTLYAVADSLRVQLRVMFAERSETMHKLERIKKVLGEHRLVLVLDEIDRAIPKERNNMLYHFLQWGNVGLVCVATSRDFLLDLDQRVLSRFVPIHVECRPYLPDDIFRILKQRASVALREGSYDHALLRMISTDAEGDARLAINVLRRAAQLAEQSRSPQIQVSEVARAFGDMKLVRRKYYLDRLSPHHRLIVQVIEAEPGISSPRLWEEYQVRCDSEGRLPVALRTFRSYVERLIQLKLIRWEPKPGDGTARIFFVS
jgi:cell division control protein 6